MMFRLLNSTRAARLLRRHGAVAMAAAVTIACLTVLAAIGTNDRRGAGADAHAAVMNAARAALDRHERAVIAFTAAVAGATDASVRPLIALKPVLPPEAREAWLYGPGRGATLLRGAIEIVGSAFDALAAAAVLHAAMVPDAAALRLLERVWPFAAIALIGVGAVIGLLGLLIRRVNAAEREIARRAGVERELRDRLETTAATADRADELGRAKSQFFAQVTHELRTPLNAILGFSETIRHQLFGPVANPRYLEYAGLINDAGSHLLSLINDLLDNSRIEAGKMEIAPVRTAPAALAGSALDLVELLADGRDIAIATSGLASCPDLNIDPRAMKQVLVNLLSNAIKYTPAGGRIDLRFSMRDDGGAAIAIADTGIGMSDADLRVAFEPFGRADVAETRRQQGSGLGLSLARALVRLHGGDITLTSALDTGTTATVLLPASAVFSAGRAARVENAAAA